MNYLLIFATPTRYFRSPLVSHGHCVSVQSFFSILLRQQSNCGFVFNRSICLNNAPFCWMQMAYFIINLRPNDSDQTKKKKDVYLYFASYVFFPLVPYLLDLLFLVLLWFQAQHFHPTRSNKSPSPINIFLSPSEPRPFNSLRCLVIIRYYTGLYGIFSSRRGSFRFNQGGWGYTGPLCVMYIIYRCSPFQWMLSTL